MQFHALTLVQDKKKNWMTFAKCWCFYTMHTVEDTSPPNHKELMNFVFANHCDETAIYPLTVSEIVEAQSMDKMLKKLTLLEKYKPQLIEDIQVLCKDGKLVILQEHIMQLNGITTTYNIQGQLVSKRLFLL